jgi:hypothetical protein
MPNAELFYSEDEEEVWAFLAEDAVAEQVPAEDAPAST